MADLRNAGDLSLRHAAAQALTRFIQAGKAANVTAADTEEASASKSLQGIALVLHRVLMPQVKQGSADINLAVRQVCAKDSQPRQPV